MLGIGLVVGVVIGAGIALLSAPRTGEETRDRIRDRVRHITGKDDAWSKLKRELKRAANVRQRSDLEKRRERDEKMLEKERAERDARTAGLGT
jgi:gas vesicle protein